MAGLLEGIAVRLLLGLRLGPRPGSCAAGVLGLGGSLQVRHQHRHLLQRLGDRVAVRVWVAPLSAKIVE